MGGVKVRTERRRSTIMWPYGTDIDPRIVKVTQPSSGSGYFGQVVAPAAGAVVAEMLIIRGATFFVWFCLSVADTPAVGRRIDLEWRNAANAVTLDIVASTPAGSSRSGTILPLVFADQQRLRAVVGAAGDANSVYTATMNIWSPP